MTHQNKSVNERGQKKVVTVLVFCAVLLLNVFFITSLYAADISVGQCDKIPEKLIVIIADRSISIEEREATLKCLTIQGDKALPVLKKQLISKNSVVREAALLGLARIGSPKAVNTLLTAYQKGQFPREEGVEEMVFGEIHNPAAAKPLAGALKKIPVADTKLAPVLALVLGMLGNKEATIALVQYAKRANAYTQQLITQKKDHGSYYAIVLQTVYTAISTTKDVPTLFTTAKNTKLFWEIRRNAIMALEKAITNDNASTDITRKIVAELTLIAEKKKPYDDEYVEVRRAADHALNALRGRGDPLYCRDNAECILYPCGCREKVLNVYASGKEREKCDKAQKMLPVMKCMQPLPLSNLRCEKNKCTADEQKY